VEVVGQTAIAALQIKSKAAGSEVRDLAIRGPQLGFLLSGSLDVTFDRVWIHDTGWRGGDVEGGLGKTSVTISRSLFEDSVELGLFVQGSKLEMVDSVVRDAQPALGGTAG